MCRHNQTLKIQVNNTDIINIDNKLSKLLFIRFPAWSHLHSLLSLTDLEKVILRKLNTIIYKLNTLDSRIELLEEQGRINDLQIKHIDLEEFGLPLADERAVQMLERKLEDKEIFESFVSCKNNL